MPHTHRSRTRLAGLRWRPLGWLLLAAACGGGEVTTQNPFFDVTLNPSVIIGNAKGPIEITQRSTGTVSVMATLHNYAEGAFDASAQGNHTVIVEALGGGSLGGPGPGRSAELTVIVPFGGFLDLEANAGDVTITGPIGRLISVTDPGAEGAASPEAEVPAVRIQGSTAELRVGKGTVSVDRYLGALTVIAGEGDVDFAGTFAGARAQPAGEPGRERHRDVTRPDGFRHRIRGRRRCDDELSAG